MAFVNILKKNAHIIMTPHCILEKVDDIVIRQYYAGISGIVDYITQAVLELGTFGSIKSIFYAHCPGFWDHCVIFSQFVILEQTMLSRWPWEGESVKSSPPGQNGHLFADDIFRCMFVNEKCCVLVEISLKFVPICPNDSNPALVQIMAWCQIGDMTLSEPMQTLFTDAYMCY